MFEGGNLGDYEGKGGDLRRERGFSGVKGKAEGVLREVMGRGKGDEEIWRWYLRDTGLVLDVFSVEDLRGMVWRYKSAGGSEVVEVCNL
jgi:hypothetical protein